MRSVAPRIFVLVALTAIAYLPAILQGGFIWDDDSYVTENRTLEQDDALRRIWTKPTESPQYYPLVFTTFLLEHRLWGERPLGYHATNVLLHALNAIVLFLLLRRLDLPGAWLAAAIFALHPVHVESVAWITERKNVLSGLFYLLSFAACLRFTGIAPDERPGTRSVPWLVLGLVLFAAALLSKTVTCTLPAALLLVLWWKRGRISAMDCLAMIPFFALGAFMGLVTARLEAAHVGTHLLDFGLTAVEHVYLATRIAWFYLFKLAVPLGLVFIYPRWAVDQGQLWQAVFPIATVVILVGLVIARSRVGRGPLVAALFFGGTLFPALGFITVFPMRYSFVADHFQYLASIGPIALFAAVATAATTRLQKRHLPTALAAALLVALSILTWRQCAMYRDIETLWRTTLARNPNASMAHINLGNILAARDEHDAAIAHFRAVAETVDPPEQDPIVHAPALLNMGNGFYKTGRPEEALDAYENACRVYDKYAKAHIGRGLTHFRLRNYDAAIQAHRRVLELHPNPIDPLHQKAQAYIEQTEALRKWQAETDLRQQRPEPPDS